MKFIDALIAGGALTLTAGSLTVAGAADFGPANPFYAPSALPFHAPPFDKIKDEDYQPAIEAGVAQSLAEIGRIADDSAPPTFDNTFVAMEKSGRLLDRAYAAFNGVSQSNTNPTLQNAKTALAPERAPTDARIRALSASGGAASGAVCARAVTAIRNSATRRRSSGLLPSAAVNCSSSGPSRSPNE